MHAYNAFVISDNKFACNVSFFFSLKRLNEYVFSKDKILPAMQFYHALLGAPIDAMLDEVVF